MAGGGQLVTGTLGAGNGCGEGAVLAFVLACTECGEVWEPSAPGDERPSDGACVACGGWSWVGELTVSGMARGVAR
jgi:hypothetical protein